MRWSEACSASQPCSCVQLVGETFLWISVLPNRLGQEGASEGSQRGSPVLPLIKHISVVSQKARWNPFNEMRVHIYHNKEKTAHCLGFFLPVLLQYDWTLFKASLLRKGGWLSAQATVNSGNPQSPKLVPFATSTMERSMGGYYLLFTRALMMN